MQNFIFQNTTKLVFGKRQISHLAQLIPSGCRLMLTFGGGSVKNNGIYDQVTDALQGRQYTEFWGIDPNPPVETLREAILIGKRENIDFVLAVGGGSVLDGTKLIAAGICYDGDPWDIVLSRQATKSIPYASVMTLPATASEMNRNSVISNLATKQKISFVTCYPEFAVLDPEVVYSMPPFQRACGLTDTFVHVIEQYMTTPGQSRLMDRWAEGIMLTVIEIAPKIMGSEHDYDHASDFMLSATMALNDFIRMGVTQDWATHMIGHELTALHGVAHAASLALVLPGLLRTMRIQKGDKLLQYGERVFGITSGSKDERTDKAIAETERFFRSLGLHTRLEEENIGMETIETIAGRFSERGAAYGENGNIDGPMTRQILMNCHPAGVIAV